MKSKRGIMKKWLLGVLVFMVFAGVYASDAQTVRLPDGRIAVISQGNLESASVGSYSVVIYSDLNLLDFKVGGVFARDGSVFMDGGKPRVDFIDINGDKIPEMIVSKLTAGSGHYLEVDVLAISENKIELLAKEGGENKERILKKLKNILDKEK